MGIQFQDIPMGGDDSLVEVFKRIHDPRSRFGKRHTLHGMLALAYCAVLCGVKSFKGIDDWSKNLTEEEKRKFDFGRHGVPTGEIIFQQEKLSSNRRNYLKNVSIFGRQSN